MQLLGIDVISFAFHILIAVRMIHLLIIICQAILYPDSFFHAVLNTRVSAQYVIFTDVFYIRSICGSTTISTHCWRY